MIKKFVPRRPWLALAFALWIGLSIHAFLVSSRTARIHDHVAQTWAKRGGKVRWVRQEADVERVGALTRAAQTRTDGLHSLTFKLLLAYAVFLQLQLADAKRRPKDEVAARPPLGSPARES